MPGVKTGSSSCSTILFIVSVPVLSEQSMSMPATSSMLERRVTMAFFSASLREPSAIVATLTTGIAIGIDATSSTTANASATSTSSPSRTVSTSSEMRRADRDGEHEKVMASSTWGWAGGGGGSS